ncbi:MAG TPA: hypothetical protein VJ372_00910 [Pyrinomonadaceae bacterium]|jgi:hypothetical protein|nr:hypothetical protein [Pyrinomonadaceae bacterium]
MSEWTVAETNTHQDHVIAHVIGATVLGYFVWEETAYLLLDIGFIWNIYLDGEMGLVPQSQAIAELEASEEFKREIKSDIDSISRDVADDSLQALSVPAVLSPIQTVDFELKENSRRLLLTCEESALVVETSLDTAEVKIYER